MSAEYQSNDLLLSALLLGTSVSRQWFGILFNYTWVQPIERVAIIDRPVRYGDKGRKDNTTSVC